MVCPWNSPGKNTGVDCHEATINHLITKLNKYHQNRKSQANTFNEYRYKNSQQNISKLNQTTYKKDHVPKPRGIYHKFTRMLQHTQNQSINAQSCPTLCNPIDCSLLGSSVHGNSGSKNTGVGLSYPSPRDLFNPGIELESLISLALAGGFFTTSATWEFLV